MTIRAMWAGWEVFYTDQPDRMGTIEEMDNRYVEWLEQMEPEPDPWSIFNDAIDEWAKLTAKLSDPYDGRSGINRMLFMQLFAIIEAYLADSIQRLAFDDDDVARAVIRATPKLAKEVVTFGTLADKPTIVRDKAVETLRRTQYHNFEAVNALTTASLNHSIWSSGPSGKGERDAIMRSVVWRHHCVHRNGRDLDGNLLDGITSPYLTEMMRRFVYMAEELDKAIMTYALGRDAPAAKVPKGTMDDDLPF